MPLCRKPRTWVKSCNNYLFCKTERALNQRKTCVYQCNGLRTMTSNVPSNCLLLATCSFDLQHVESFYWNPPNRTQRRDREGFCYWSQLYVMEIIIKGNRQSSSLLFHWLFLQKGNLKVRIIEKCSASFAGIAVSNVFCLRVFAHDLLFRTIV